MPRQLRKKILLATAINLIGTIPLMRICSAMNRKAAKNPVANFIQARVIGNLIHGNGGTYLADSSCARAMARAMMADASKEIPRDTKTSTNPTNRERVLITGAADRDFHTFNV
jgi:hypothetical protein